MQGYSAPIGQGYGPGKLRQFGADIVADFDAIATSTDSSANGVLLYNRTAAADGAQQYSPIDALEGQGWKTDATAASQACVLYRQVRPVQGAAAPTFVYVWSRKIGAAAAADLMSLTSAGTLYFPAGGDIGGTDSNQRPNNIYATGFLSFNASAAYSARAETRGDTPYAGILVSAVGTGIGLYSLRTSGAGNVSAYVVADVNVAAINDLHEIMQWRWTNNSDVSVAAFKVLPKAIQLATWATSAAPTGAAGQLAYVTDGDTGSPCLAVHNGTNWLRIALGAAIASS